MVSCKNRVGTEHMSSKVYINKSIHKHCKEFNAQSGYMDGNYIIKYPLYSLDAGIFYDNTKIQN